MRLCGAWKTLPGYWQNGNDDANVNFRVHAMRRNNHCRVVKYTERTYSKISAAMLCEAKDKYEMWSTSEVHAQNMFEWESI